AMQRGPSPTSTTAEHLLGGVQRVRTRVRGFAPWSPEKATLALLDQVQGILDEYVDHLPLTIRQIFYRLVGAHDYEKTERAYQRLVLLLESPRSHAARGDEFRSPALGGAIAAAASESRFLVMR